LKFTGDYVLYYVNVSLSIPAVFSAALKPTLFGCVRLLSKFGGFSMKSSVECWNSGCWQMLGSVAGSNLYRI